MLHFRGFRSVGGGRQSPSQTPLAAENFGLLLYDVVFLQNVPKWGFLLGGDFVKKWAEKTGGGF